jgi:hypothetical protein
MHSDPMDNKEQTIVKITLGDLIPEIIDPDDTEIDVTCDVYHNQVVCIDGEITIKLSSEQVKKIGNMLTRKLRDNNIAHDIEEAF